MEKGEFYKNQDFTKQGKKENTSKKKLWAALEFLGYNQYYNENDEITVTAGATQAIFTTISALIHPKDEVIIFSPSFDCYQPAVELNGGIPIFVELESPDFKVNWETLEESISSKTRMIIINSPHNPLGLSCQTKTWLT